ncbi:MAG: hypothetical protein P9X24_19190 [Candidatus Hatepunaea meridiana]|nr:hypothetical protein [Candidatus Hatepunaea meridiana]
MNDLQNRMNARLNNALTSLIQKEKVPDIYLVKIKKASEFFEEGESIKAELLEVKEDHIVIGDMFGNTEELSFEKITHWGYSVDDPIMHLILLNKATP